MIKFLTFFISFILSTIVAYSADLKFIQVDSVNLNAKDEVSVNKFKNLVKDINKQKNIDFIIFSGDNISKAKKENLDCFLKIAKNLNFPYYTVIGDKDVNKQSLSKKDYMHTIRKKNKAHRKINSPNFVVKKNKIAIFIVDGSKEVITTPMGFYKDDTIKWLENNFHYYQDKNIIIFQHFPLVPPAQKELRYTAKPENYLELVNQYDNIKAIFSGNFNTNAEKKVNNILHISTADFPKYRIIDMMDYDTPNPTFWSVIKD